MSLGRTPSEPEQQPASELAAPLAPLPARWAAERVAAGGAFGEVLRGTDRETGAPIALKRLRADVADGPSRVRFEREASLLSRIDDPHVVRLLAAGTDAEGRPTLVLEWLEGSDLRALLRDRRVAARDAIELVREAALGLAALHAQGIVHGDVKPANFFVLDPPRDGVRVKLVDLGVARISETSDATFDGLLVGTPAYMAPEQARGDAALTVAADLFSLGVVLYELAAGRRPFTGSDPFALVVKILLEEPPPLRHLVPELPEALERVVMRALDKDPARRFASARELAQALEGLDVPVALRGSSPDETPTVTVPSATFQAHGERRVVTTLFAALGGDDAGAFERLVGAQGGAVHAALGGRRVAVFGELVSRGDEAQRAARAALAIAEASPRARLALTTGRVLADARGPAGDAIDRGAAAVEGARPGAVAVDATTARLVEGAFRVDGQEGDLLLVGPRAEHTGVTPLLLGRTTPMVGRERELDELEAAWRACVAGGGARVVLVTGPAGSGKSRLRFELVERLRGAGEPLQLLLARGDPVAAGAPFALLAELVRRWAGLVGGETPRRGQRKLLAQVERAVAHAGGATGAVDARRVAVLLGEMVGVRWGDDASRLLRAARRDAVLMGDAMLSAWQALVGALCSRGPVLLVLEDLQWGDRPTVRFVDEALRALSDRRLMVLALARPEIASTLGPPWADRGRRDVVLEPLEPAEAALLVRAVLGDLPDGIVQAVVERAEGNAFFLEELVRALASSLAAEPRADGAPRRAARSLPLVEALPETIGGMVQARLDALGPGARRALRAASVFGRTFWRGAVAALLGGDPDAALDELVRDEVVLRRPTARLPGEVELAFRHALLRDATYASLTDDDRRAGHRLALEWLERAGEHDAATLAHHAALGGEGARAAVLYRRAAEQALEGNDLTGALDLSERAARAGAAGADLVALRLVQAESLRWRGDHAGALARAGEARALAAPGSSAYFRAVAELVVPLGRLGRYDDGAAALADAAACRPALEREGPDDPVGDDERAKIVCLARGAMHLFYGGRSTQALATVAAVERLVADETRLDPIAMARVHQMRAVQALHGGDTGGYLAAHEAARRAFEEVGDARSACHALVALGSGYADVGLWERAEEALTAALSSARHLGLTSIEAWARQNLGNVLAERGRRAEAARALEDALAAGTAQGDARLAGGARIYLSRLALAEGDAPRAEAHARAAVQLLDGAPAMCAGACAALADAHRAGGDAAAALGSARRGVAYLDGLGESGAGELEAVVRLAEIEALLAAGDEAAARAAAAVAAKRLRARAQRLRDDDVRRAFSTGVREHVRTLELAARWNV